VTRHVASSYWAERLAAGKFPENRENFPENRENFAFTGVNQLESRNFLSESRWETGNFWGKQGILSTLGISVIYYNNNIAL
jgi:hypothetical protein